MKTRIIYLAAAACAMLASCGKEESPKAPGMGDGRIVFGVEEAFKVSTKAVTESTVSLVQTNGFKVAGITSAGSTMFNDVASYNSTKSYYETAQTYYWPSSGTMSFYAVYPKTQAIAVAAGAATLAYTSDGNTDLLAAKAEGVSKPESPASQPLVFDHILSQYMMNAKGDTPGLTYRVSSVSLATPGTGTYAYADGSWARGANTDKSYFSGTQDISGTTAASFGDAMTVLPGDVVITVKYKVFDGTIELGDYTKSQTVSLTKGKKCTVNATLPFDGAAPITFTVTVNPWGTESRDVTFE